MEIQALIGRILAWSSMILKPNKALLKVHSSFSLGKYWTGVNTLWGRKSLGCYGDGGAVFADSSEVAHIVDSIRVYGRGERKHDNVRIGTNSRLDTIQAAVLLSKLEIFQLELNSRRRIAPFLLENFPESTVQCKLLTTDSASSWAQFSFCLKSRDKWLNRLKELGISSVIYYPRTVGQQSAYSGYPSVSSVLNSMDHADQIMSSPFHPYLFDNELGHLVTAFSVS